MVRIGIVAGEASGDYLGAELIKGLKSIHQDIQVEGIGGEKMQSEGCRSLFAMQKLSVMGIVEVLGSYFELLSIRNQLVQYFLSNPPDIFIGIDAPDFNLELERKLREKGVCTVHYVSPSVWAWRKYRIRKIAAATNLVMTLFPFETEIYRRYGIPAKFVGHPLATRISMQPDRRAARERLNMAPDGLVIGIMPGSRKSELTRLWAPFLQAAQLCLHKTGKIRFIANVLDRNALVYCEKVKIEQGLDHLPLDIYQNHSHDVLEASDVVLLASGTVTLEAMLFKRPMVVAYKLNPISHFLVKMLTYIKHAALPNLLAGEELVPECLQNDCNAEKLAEKLQGWIDNPASVTELQARFTQIHQSLLGDADSSAAHAVLELLDNVANSARAS